MVEKNTIFENEGHSVNLSEISVTFQKRHFTAEMVDKSLHAPCNFNIGLQH